MLKRRSRSVHSSIPSPKSESLSYYVFQILPPFLILSLFIPFFVPATPRYTIPPPPPPLPPLRQRRFANTFARYSGLFSNPMTSSANRRYGYRVQTSIVLILRPSSPNTYILHPGRPAAQPHLDRPSVFLAAVSLFLLFAASTLRSDDTPI